MLCICENRFVLVLSFLWNYSIFSQGISARLVTALSVCEYGTECTLSYTNISVVKFFFFHRLISSPSAKHSNLEVCLWYNGQQWPFTPGQQQDIWPLYSTSGLLSNICVRQQGSKRISTHLIGSFVDLFRKNTWTSCPFHSPPYLRGWRGTSALQVAFDGLAKHLVQTSNPTTLVILQEVQHDFSPLFCVYFTVYLVHCFCWYLTRCMIFIEITWWTWTLSSNT